MLIAKLFGVRVKGDVDATNALGQGGTCCSQEHSQTKCICGQGTMECDIDEKEYHVKFVAIL